MAREPVVKWEGEAFQNFAGQAQALGYAKKRVWLLDSVFLTSL